VSIDDSKSSKSGSESDKYESVMSQNPSVEKSTLVDESTQFSGSLVSAISYKSISAISVEDFVSTAVSIDDSKSSKSGSESDKYESVMSQNPSVEKSILEDESS